METVVQIHFLELPATQLDAINNPSWLLPTYDTDYTWRWQVCPKFFFLFHHLDNGGISPWLESTIPTLATHTILAQLPFLLAWFW